MYQIVRLQPDEVSADDASIGIAEASPGDSVAARLRHLLPPDHVPARVPLVLLWRAEPLSSVDTLDVTGTSRHDQQINLTVEIRRFVGPVHGDVVTVPVVEVDIGTLDPGPYNVTVQDVELSFTDYGHPEHAVDPSTRQVDFSFVVSPGLSSRLIE